MMTKYPSIRESELSHRKVRDAEPARQYYLPCLSPPCLLRVAKFMPSDRHSFCSSTRFHLSHAPRSRGPAKSFGAGWKLVGILPYYTN